MKNADRAELAAMAATIAAFRVRIAELCAAERGRSIRAELDGAEDRAEDLIEFLQAAALTPAEYRARFPWPAAS